MKETVNNPSFIPWCALKKVIAFLSISVLFSLSAVAQPTISLEDATPCSGESFCLDVAVKDFTDILSTTYSIRWDPAVLQFDQINGINLDMLTLGNFDLTQVNDGIIVVDWAKDNCSENAVGVTLADGAIIYQLCFTALGGYGAATDVAITSDPVGISITRVNACPNNIGLIREDAYVSTCVRPLTLRASSEIANPGDLVCVDFSVEGFDDLTSMQFSIKWDPNILEFENVIPSEDLPNLALSSFGCNSGNGTNIPPGTCTVSWAFVNVSDPGVSLPDSTVIFQICYRVIGECETATDIEFSSDPTPKEVTNTVEEGFNIVIIEEQGEVEVSDCDPDGLQVIANCGAAVELNDEVCVEITTAGFNMISDFRYLMEWNPNILQFKEIRDLNGILNQTDFNEVNVGNGILGVDWENIPSQTLPDGTALYNVCFDVVGLGGNSPINFDQTTALVRNNNGPNIGIFPSNCEVEVIQPPGLTMDVSSGQAPVGDTVCVDVTVGNFNELLSLQFSLAWDDSQIEYLGFENLMIPEAGAAIINETGNGGLTFEWDPAGNHSLPDGTVLFQLCYRLIGDPETCDNIEFVDLPLEGEVINVNSNGNNIGLTGQVGEICILNPEGFYIGISEETGEPGDTVCVSLEVGGFDDITSAQYSLNWDPTALSFVEINDPGVLVGQNFDETSTGVGVLSVDWSDLTGVSIADSTIIYDVCFELIGLTRNCYGIEVSAQPDPIVTTLDGDGSVQSDSGSICIKPVIVVLDTIITPVSCDGARDGSIELVVSTLDGNDENIFFNWASSPIQFTNRAQNLPVGQVEVVIFSPGDDLPELRDTFFIPLSEDIPNANIIGDSIRQFPCNLPLLLLEGEDQGEGYSYSWRTLGGDLSPPLDEANVFVEGSGVYILEVSNDNTGCTVRDTSLVIEPALPFADAGDDKEFSCQTDNITIGGPNSTSGDGVSYKWRTTDTGVFVPGQDTVAMPQILAGGTYILEVAFTETGCFRTDTVVVADVSVYPTAVAGDDQEIDCFDDAMVELDGSASTGENALQLQWCDPSGAVLQDGAVFQATQEGMYILKVTDQVTLCTGRDTVNIIPNQDVPTTMITEDTSAITCIMDTIGLVGAVTSPTNFSFEWTAINGGNIVPGTDMELEASATAPGLYILEATNSENGCSSADSIIVVDNRTEPQVEAGMDITIDCNCTLLDGTASEQNDGSAYIWTREGEMIAEGTLMPEVCAAGVYYLEIIDGETGCSAIDSVEVVQEGDPPIVTFNTVPAETCKDGALVIEASVEPANGNYSIEWTIIEGNGAIVNGQGTLGATVSEAGTYRITVSDLDSGCPGISDIVVELDKDTPQVSGMVSGAIDCNNAEVTLTAEGSSTGTDFTYNWELQGGSGTTLEGFSVITSESGNWELTVIDTTNGCSATQSIMVMDNGEYPEIIIDTPDSITCNVDMVSLSALDSDPKGANFSVQWTSITGGVVNPANELVTMVDAGGTYELFIRNEDTGCETRDTIAIVEDKEEPDAMAGEDIVLECNENTTQLDGSGSSNGSATSYEWRLNGGLISVEINPTVNVFGTYTLTVTNDLTGCSATDSVMVSQGEVLPLAEAGSDQSLCTDTTSIEAVLPQGFIGEWVSLSVANIVTPTASKTVVNNLQAGENVFAWTLSSEQCPDYSSDTIRITVEAAPVASDDLHVLTEGVISEEITVLNNDLLAGVSMWSLTILDEPTRGSAIESESGNILYTVAGAISGMDQFTYSLCNEMCLELCDTALVRIEIPVNDDFKQYNAITPNGDGMNEALIFEELNIGLEEFPDNELIIFNRWGDIVHTSKPYANDWTGTNDSGEALPDGTYYYILRLNVSEGNIVRGDVTIVR